MFCEFCGFDGNGYCCVCQSGDQQPDPLDNPLFTLPTAEELEAMFAELGEADPFK